MATPLGYFDWAASPFFKQGNEQFSTQDYYNMYLREFNSPTQVATQPNAQTQVATQQGQTIFPSGLFERVPDQPTQPQTITFNVPYGIGGFGVMGPRDLETGAFNTSEWQYDPTKTRMQNYAAWADVTFRDRPTDQTGLFTLITEAKVKPLYDQYAAETAEIERRSGLVTNEAEQGAFTRDLNRFHSNWLGLIDDATRRAGIEVDAQLSQYNQMAQQMGIEPTRQDLYAAFGLAPPTQFSRVLNPSLPATAPTTQATTQQTSQAPVAQTQPVAQSEAMLFQSQPVAQPAAQAVTQPVAQPATPAESSFLTGAAPVQPSDAAQTANTGMVSPVAQTTQTTQTTGSNMATNLPTIDNLSGQDMARAILEMAAGRRTQDMRFDMNGDGQLSPADAANYLRQFDASAPTKVTEGQTAAPTDLSFLGPDLTGQGVFTRPRDQTGTVEEMLRLADAQGLTAAMGGASIGAGGIPVGIGGQPAMPQMFLTGTATQPTGLTPESLPDLRGTATGQSAVDPTLRPYLELGLRGAEQLFLQQAPSLYPGQMYVSPSQQTLDALAQTEQIARAQPSALQAAQESYMAGLGGLGFTAGGGFLGSNPFQQRAIEAATRPIMQQFEQTTLPTIAGQFSAAGRYGSGAMGRITGQAQEASSRALGDVAANIAYTDYARERGLQDAAIRDQIQASTLAPQIYGQQFLPAQQLAQVGAAREAIAAQPLQEAITRYQYQQQLPYQQLGGFLSSIYGTPLAGSQYQTPAQAQTNRAGSALGLAATGAGIGNLIGGTTGAAWGAGLGALAGLLG